MKAGTEKLLDKYNEKDFIKFNQDSILKCVNLLLSAFISGGRLLICGNGGSCADADHIVGELVKAFRITRPLDKQITKRLKEQGRYGMALAENLQAGLPAINLCAQTALMTAMINDVGGEYVFAQEVMAYGHENDVLLGISTSGNSKNVLFAGAAARAKGMKTIGLSGRTGGTMAKEFDIMLYAQADSTEDIQDQHSAIYHALCAAIEYELWGE